MNDEKTPKVKTIRDRRTKNLGNPTDKYDSQQVLDKKTGENKWVRTRIQEVALTLLEGNNQKATDARKSALHHEAAIEHHESMAHRYENESDYSRAQLHDRAANLHTDAHVEYHAAADHFAAGREDRGEARMDRAERRADQAEDHEKEHGIEHGIHEAFGKGDIDAIGKYHSDRMTKGRHDGEYHAVQRNRARRLKDIRDGTGPLGKTTMKDRAEYAAQDSKLAKSLKPKNLGEAEESLQAKMARQRAAREARDGTPEQRAEVEKKLRGQKTMQSMDRRMHKIRRLAGNLARDLGGDVPDSVRKFIRGDES